jgi:hypothetical protein
LDEKFFPDRLRFHWNRERMSLPAQPDEPLADQEVTSMSNLQITADATVTAESFVAAATEGKVKFHTVRGDGTTRRVQFFSRGSKARKQAEWVYRQRTAGRSMADIATEMHVSIPSVRRIINALLLAREVEALKADEVEALLADAKRDSDKPIKTPEEIAAEEAAARKEAARLHKNELARKAYAAKKAQQQAEAK